MILKINKQNRVVFACRDNTKSKLIADGEYVFEVEAIPEFDESKFLFYNPESQEFYTEDKPTPSADVLKRKKIEEAKTKKEKALKWLADNDWKVNKRTLGEWAETDDRWIEYLADRKKARSDYDEAVSVLNG